MRDDDHAARVAAVGAERALQIGRALRVEVRGRLVEDEVRGVGDESARHRDPAALAARDRRALLARTVSRGAAGGNHC